ncbi:MULTISPECIES: glutaredoxin 3 [Ponticaulis]|jgi:glutaredoxin 3|uniref:glutaredoxin 3 n=1 Tax=Ponticaulis TaxID=1123044 RepID=UPI0003B707B9|nr:MULTISPECIES: glutaredoxin 3 [Ponticaulis]MAJ10738.1 glutaredoxin 3 [Ponticaulis sp.]MBN03733.1 glutaredoxin 3 [Ponticaulis sp.]HBJ94342.1 glutaredoxin 3 [Hyphomonadaceae bacterium]|tara:strand:+ start:17631 stop:17891 length:261 start_codon:yes stop_codon:yes gene_type:complete
MAKVEIYTRQFCPYCTRALSLLDKKGVKYTHVDAGMDPQKRQEMIQRANGGSTYPQIFINDDHIGGCDEMFALERAGKLDPLLSQA